MEPWRAAVQPPHERRLPLLGQEHGRAAPQHPHGAASDSSAPLAELPRLVRRQPLPPHFTAFSPNCLLIAHRLSRLLHKSAASRMSVADVRRHPWVASGARGPPTSAPHAPAREAAMPPQARQMAGSGDSEDPNLQQLQQLQRRLEREARPSSAFTCSQRDSQNGAGPVHTSRLAALMTSGHGVSGVVHQPACVVHGARR